LISSKFLPQKLKNGFALGDARWRVHSVTHQTNTGFVRCRTDLCAKSYKIKKIGLKPLGKKFAAAAGAAAANFFSKRYKGHRRCPLLAAATVGL